MNKIKSIFNFKEKNKKQTIAWKTEDGDQTTIEESPFNISDKSRKKGTELLKENPKLLKSMFTLDKMNRDAEK